MRLLYTDLDQKNQASHDDSEGDEIGTSRNPDFGSGESANVVDRPDSDDLHGIPQVGEPRLNSTADEAQFMRYFIQSIDAELSGRRLKERDPAKYVTLGLALISCLIEEGNFEEVKESGQLPKSGEKYGRALSRISRDFFPASTNPAVQVLRMVEIINSAMGRVRREATPRFAARREL
jgi:hypothetical protein